MIRILLNINLAFFVFISSSGFWIFNHYCQNELTKTSFIISFGTCCSNAPSPCSDDIAAMTCSDEEGKEGEDGCCENNPDYYKLDQEQFFLKTEYKDSDLKNTVQYNFTRTYSEIQNKGSSHLSYNTYVPPDIVYNRQVRLQTFLC